MAKEDSEWWIGTITIDLAKIKYLKIKGRFNKKAGESAINLRVIANA